MDKKFRVAVADKVLKKNFLPDVVSLNKFIVGLAAIRIQKIKAKGQK